MTELEDVSPERPFMPDAIRYSIGDLMIDTGRQIVSRSADPIGATWEACAAGDTRQSRR
jgi:hypothetical protein